jgi:hypothetical protein
MIQCRESEGAEGTFATLNQRTSQISMVILIRLLLGHPLGGACLAPPLSDGA